MSASNEYVILKCIVIWIIHDKKDRLQHAKSLWIVVFVVKV